MPQLKYKTIPTKNEIIPYFVLAILENEGVTSINHIEQELIKCFNLKAEDLRIKFENSTLSVFHYRFLEVKRKLEAAKIIEVNETTDRVKITERGKKAYNDTNGEITLKYLKRYEEYRNYQSKKQKEAKTIQTKEINIEIPKTQQLFKTENVNKLFPSLNLQILNIPFEKFKKLIIELLYKLEYGTKKRIRKNIYEFENSILKGVIYKDNLNIGVSLYLYAIHAPNGILEAKKFQDFIYQVNSNPNNKFLFITNGDVSTKQFYIDSLKERNVKTIDVTELAKLLIECKVGVKEKIEISYSLDENL